MSNGPGDHVAVAVQPTRSTRLRTDHLSNIASNRRFFSDDDHSHGLVPDGTTNTLGKESSFPEVEGLVGRGRVRDTIAEVDSSQSGFRNPKDNEFG